MSEKGPEQSGHSPSQAWTLAAPSFVWPDRVGENCRRLESWVDEVSLILFETRACLDYTQDDLPSWLPELKLSYHVHLPLDLPWEQGGKAVAELALQLADKTAFCRPWGFVLHPPSDPDIFLDFHHYWCAAGWPSQSLILENIEDNDLLPLLPVLDQTQCRICIDIGHLLAFGQERIRDQAALLQRLAMLHIYAPVNGDKHAALDRLSAPGRALLAELLTLLPPQGVIVFEVFRPAELGASLDIFSLWIRNWDSHFWFREPG